MQQPLQFPGLHNRLDAVFGALDAASGTDWKLQSSMICDDGGKGSPGEDDDEDAQDRCRPTADHPKLCSLSAFDVTASRPLRHDSGACIVNWNSGGRARGLRATSAGGSVRATSTGRAARRHRSCCCIFSQVPDSLLSGCMMLWLHRNSGERNRSSGERNRGGGERKEVSTCISFGQTGSCRFGERCRYQHLSFDPTKYTKYEIDWNEPEVSNASAAAHVFEQLRKKNENQVVSELSTGTPVFRSQGKKSASTGLPKASQEKVVLSALVEMDDDGDAGDTQVEPVQGMPKRKRQYRQKKEK